MRRSTDEQIQEVRDLVLLIRLKIEELLQSGKKVHIIWDFDGVLADSRSDDIFALAGFDFKKYFAHEERLLFQSPGEGLWLLPVAHNAGAMPYFPPDRFSQDIVTARSTTTAIRVHIFCIEWQLPVRWMLFLGHQPKNEAYRIILKSLKDDLDYRVFCIDDSAKHIDAFRSVSVEEGMEDRAFGIVSPVIRAYSEEELKKYFDSVMGADGNTPMRVRDPSDDMRGFIVLPRGLRQFSEEISSLVSRKHDEGHVAELRNAFVKAHGEVGEGRFKTEEELELAMKEFIVGLWCP